MVQVDPRDMLNKFCFHVYAQNLLFMGENTQGGGGLENAYFCKKSANFSAKMLHRFDSFKSCFGVIEKWENFFFGIFVV